MAARLWQTDVLQCSSHTWNWCTPVMHLWLQHTPALSKSKFIGLTPRCWVTAFAGNAIFFQHEEAADLMRSENDAIIGVDESKSQQLIPFPSLAVCPFSRGRGTTSKYDAKRNIIRSGVLICIVSTAGSASVYKIWPHHCGEGAHAGFPQSTEKAKVAMITLKCPWISELS